MVVKPLAAAALLLATAIQCNAFQRTFDPLTFTREAESIFTAEVRELRDKSIVVEPKETLKGSPAKKVEIPWEREPKWETTQASYKVGEELLVFGKKRGDRFEALGGAEGTLDLGNPKNLESADAVRALLALDRANTPDRKTKALLALLRNDQKAQRLAGLHIITAARYYGDKIDKKAVRQAVSSLLANPDSQIAGNAVDAIAVVGDKSDVPTLIELLGADDKNVATAAYETLRSWTRADIPVDLSKTPADRKEAIGRWRKWWSENGEKVRLGHSTSKLPESSCPHGTHPFVGLRGPGCCKDGAVCD